MADVVPLLPPEQSGAVKTTVVLGILKGRGVDASDAGNGMTRLVRDDVIEVHKLGVYVHRRLVNRFARKFDIPISTFYS